MSGYLYVEVWNSKPAWRQASSEERLKFVGSVNELLMGLISDDLYLLGCLINEEEVLDRADYQYCAIWKASDKKHIKLIEDGTRGIGWHDYFEQVNLGGEHFGPESVVEHMVQQS